MLNSFGELGSYWIFWSFILFVVACKQVYGQATNTTLDAGSPFGQEQASSPAGLAAPPANAFPPLLFVKNQGQWDADILYRANLPGNGQLFLRSNSIAVTIFNPEDIENISHQYHPDGNATAQEEGNTGAMRTQGKALSSQNQDLRWVVHGQMYEIHFAEANPQPQIVADHPSTTYYNYFIGNDPARWATHVQAFEAVTYQQLYPHIDLRVFSSASQLTYDLIVYPGGNPNQVVMHYQGADKIEVKKGKLIISTHYGQIEEQMPYAYQYVGNEKRTVNCKFRVKGNQVQFHFPNPEQWDRRYPLIIDPTIVFSSFTGSRADNWGYTATYDAQGNMYVGGIVFGQGYPTLPTNPGPFQSSFAGGSSYEGNAYGFDMGISKFSPNGRTLLYATYVGGSGNEQPHSLVVNSQGNLIIAGRTNSYNYPVYPQGNKVGPTGGWDIVVTELNATGTALIGSMVIGGRNDDGVNITSNRASGTVGLLRNYGDDGRSEVIVDNAGYVYVASSTQSADFPTTAGVFQPNKGDPANSVTRRGRGSPITYNQQDGVVIKLKPDLSGIVWSSFLGGNGDDAAFVLKLDASGNLYVAGATNSTNLERLATNPSGVIQNSFQGGDADGFIAEITNDGSKLLRLTYLGTRGADEIYGIALDRNGFIYVCGTTTGNWPVINAQYFNQGAKQFIAKLQPDLSAYVYSTTFGSVNATMPNISPVAFLVDRCENVYVSGWGGGVCVNNLYYEIAGTYGMPITPDAIKKTTDGRDFYFFVLERNATNILYGSFFGQDGGCTDHVDGGTSRFDPNGIIYQAICANCGGGAIFPTTPGVWSPSNPTLRPGNPYQGAMCNEVALKIAFNLSGVHVGLKSVGGDTSGCVPFTVQIEDTAGLAKRYVWDFEDGSGEVVTTQGSQQHTYTRVGRYRVMVVGIDSSSCNVADTGYMWVKVGDNPARIGFLIEKVGPCTSWQYRFINTSVAMGGGAFTDSSFEWDFGDGSGIVRSGVDTLEHGYGSAGVYGVKLRLIDTNFCNAPVDSEKVLRVASNVRANFSVGKIGCAPYEAVFENRSEGGIGFEWDFGDGSSSNEVSPVHLYSKAGEYIVRLIASDSTTCNKADTMVDTIRVYGRPVSDFVVSPVPPQENVAEVFTNLSQGGVRWWWDFGDGSGDTTYNTSHLYSASGQYEACLRVANEWGCEDTSCRVVEALIHPMFDVPSAFSPNGDGVNDKFLVRGYGIGRFEIEIYNRWGQKVYESRDINQGWDGTYRGKPQPMDAYAYVIHIQFTDGRRITRTGNVTLLR
ncbi:MAG: PKD domain-containing protein [Thermoflavifilum sp.]|nr:PKD domain-containing protein [Thermoflavifilum sp.]